LQDFVLDVQTHFPYIGEGRREVNYFDCFTNHSCEPNMFYPSTDIRFDPDGLSGEYVACATRDIEAGDELTCDYELFDWDCLDKGLTHCMCKAAACRGTISGMRYRPFDELLTQLAAVEPIMRESIHLQYPDIRYMEMAPCSPGVDLVFNPGLGWGLVAACDFVAGQILYEGESCSVDCDSVQLVACGFFPSASGGRVPPKTATFSISEVRAASVEDDSCPACREFFAFGLSHDLSAANAEILRDREAFDACCSSSRKYQVKATRDIAIGQIVVCTMYSATSSC